MKKKYTACVIGTGRIGFTLGFDSKREQPASHTMALLKNPNIRIIAGCDTNHEQLNQFKYYVDSRQTNIFSRKEDKIKIFSDVDELFKNCNPDIVTIAVNEDSHLSVALNVISKKPRLVILEKPVALNSKEASLIEKAAKKYSVPILVNHERRFALDYNAARDFISQIGDVQKIDARLYSGMRLYDPRHEKDGGYSLLHDGTHLVDIVLFLLESLGEKKLSNPVITGLYKDPKDKKVIRSLTANYSTKKVPDISITMSGRSRFFGFEVEVLGTEGRISIGNGHADFDLREESKLYTGFYSLSKAPGVKIPHKTKYFANMVQNAVDFLDGTAPLKSTLATGINALKVLEDIKKALN